MGSLGVEEFALNRATTCLLPPYYTAGPLRRLGHLLAAPFKAAAWACAGAALRKELQHDGESVPR